MSEPVVSPDDTAQARYDAALALLTSRQRKFVAEYLACLNASQAARRAGYSEKIAAVTGHENLRKPKIAAAVSAGLDLQAMPSAEVLARLSAQARGSMADLLRVNGDEVRLDLAAAARANKLGLVKKYTLDEKGKVTVELYDAQRALELLGKHHGLFVDRHEHTGADGAPIQIIEVVTPEAG